MNIKTEKVGGIWHGYVVGHFEINERALTEEIARAKAEQIAAKLRTNDPEGTKE
jgi:hypothetical protein